MESVSVTLDNLFEIRRLCDKYGYDNPVLIDILGFKPSAEGLGVGLQKHGKSFVSGAAQFQRIQS